MPNYLSRPLWHSPRCQKTPPRTDPLCAQASKSPTIAWNPETRPVSDCWYWDGLVLLTVRGRHSLWPKRPGTTTTNLTLHSPLHRAQAHFTHDITLS